MNGIDLDKFSKEWDDKQSGDFFKIPTGNTKLRIMAPFVKVQSAWVGKYPASKPTGIVHEGRPLQQGEELQESAWTWALVREINLLKILRVPMGLLAKIAKLKQDAEYTWNEYPMPFDITISNTGEGGDRYSITPARQNTEVTVEEMALLNKCHTIPQIVQSIIDKQSGKTASADGAKIEYPTEDSDGIPF